MKLGTAYAPSPHLLDQVREQIRYRQYILSAEKTHPLATLVLHSQDGQSASRPALGNDHLPGDYYIFHSIGRSIHEG